MRAGAVTLLATLLAPLALAACDAPVIAPPYPPVPVPYAEIMPKPPVSEQPLIWQPGHWDFANGAYAWTGGAWVLRAGHGTSWQDGYWTQTSGAWVWVAPHWT